ncbi:redox-regulated ATPase YchF [candidate division KSB1 bacterium RBG_16_48_16]|nr:MAG: redox-regulated ATPase YchF [candidate division KSB1 bacterium RBG_16_48_16]
MKIGIVGLPLSGKTTLFNALTGSRVNTTAFLGGKNEAHHAVVQVPDDRLDQLVDIFHPKKRTPATIDYIDLAGLSTGEQKSHGFSDQFLGQLRTVDAILLTVRSFDDAAVLHPLDTIDPQRDLKLAEAEFILSDLAIIENRMARLEKQMRAKKADQDVREHVLLQKFKNHLENEEPLRKVEIADDEEALVRGYQFLTLKPQIVVVNIGESDIGRENELSRDFLQTGSNQHTLVLPISAQIEMELQQLSEAEAETFRRELGIVQSAMSRLIRASYDLLGLISFLTVGEDDVHAWTIRQNTPAPAAAGAVHSDMERGFIRAEVVSYQEFIQRGSYAKCRADGVLRLEGREYIVRDGDIINFRFAV